MKAAHRRPLAGGRECTAAVARDDRGSRSGAPPRASTYAARSARRWPPGPASHDRLGDRVRASETIHRVCGLASSSVGREALGLDEARQHEPDVNAVRALLGVQRVAPADQGELARRVGAGVGPRDARRGAGDVDDGTRRSPPRPRSPRSSGSSASVSRTGASKFSFMWRSMFAQPVSAKRPRQAAPALLTSRCSSPCSRSTASRTCAGASCAPSGRRPPRGPVAPPSSRRAARSRSSRRATSTRRASRLAREPPRGRLADPAGGAGDQERRMPSGRSVPAQAYSAVRTGRRSASRWRYALRVAYPSEQRHAGLDHRPVLHGRDRLRHELDRRADAVLPRPFQGHPGALAARHVARCCPTRSGRSPG